jgi:hypothetical protein
MIQGARQLPTMHVSVRVPWHDSRWAGGVCANPRGNLHHSIRSTIEDGFLLPYHDLLELAAKDPNIDLASLVLHAPDEHWDAFPMGTEHVTHDQAITVLLSCASLLERLEKLVPGNWNVARAWVDYQPEPRW